MSRVILGRQAHTTSSRASSSPGMTGPASARSVAAGTFCCSSSRSSAAHGRGSSRLDPSGEGGLRPPCKGHKELSLCNPHLLPCMHRILAAAAAAAAAPSHDRGSSKLGPSADAGLRPPCNQPNKTFMMKSCHCIKQHGMAGRSPCTVPGKPYAVCSRVLLLPH